MSRAFCSQVMCSRKALTDAARRVQRESQGCCCVNPAFRRGIASTGTVREATDVACGAQVPAAASGLIAGDGMWTIPSCILSIAKVSPPVCMSFASSAAALAAAPAAG